mmetsp:Transcript_9997/g.28121  ORF Transcript_9997/g.28121 Transcript_9997/m.28121 type:complete len:311 (-) Transcript_9997:704-1636(-)
MENPGVQRAARGFEQEAGRQPGGGGEVRHAVPVAPADPRGAVHRVHRRQLHRHAAAGGRGQRGPAAARHVGPEPGVVDRHVRGGAGLKPGVHPGEPAVVRPGVPHERGGQVEPLHAAALARPLPHAVGAERVPDAVPIQGRALPGGGRLHLPHPLRAVLLHAPLRPAHRGVCGAFHRGDRGGGPHLQPQRVRLPGARQRQVRRAQPGEQGAAQLPGQDGEELPELRYHVRRLGAPRRRAAHAGQPEPVQPDQAGRLGPAGAPPERGGGCPAGLGRAVGLAAGVGGPEAGGGGRGRDGPHGGEPAAAAKVL